jgi:hypothetical protein
MTVPSLQNNFITELVKQIRLLTIPAAGSGLNNRLAVEHEILILFNPEQVFDVLLLAYLNNSNEPPVFSRLSISTLVFTDINVRDEAALVSAQHLFKALWPLINGQDLLPTSENLPPYNAHMKRVLV